jgi:integrase
MSLAAARTAAIEARAQVDGGGDPSAQVGGTVGALIETYATKHLSRLRRGYQVAARLRLHVGPVIGSIPLAELHRRDVNRVLDPLGDRPAQLATVHGNLSSMLNWAVARGDLERNVVDGMKPPPAPAPRERVLSDAEIRTLWTSLDDSAFATILRLCLVTGQRVGEVSGMTAAELDLAERVWRLPGARTKNGHAHTVPLSDLALELIGDGEWLGTVNVARVSRMVYDQQFGLAQRWSVHDLRRTALTGMARLGVEPIVLGHVANHRSTTKAGMTLSVYVHHAYEGEKRRALDLWSDRLRGIIAGTASGFLSRCSGRATASCTSSMGGIATRLRKPAIAQTTCRTRTSLSCPRVRSWPSS